MSNDLISNEMNITNITVDFSPSKITIQNKEKLEDAIDAYIEKNSNLVINEENLEATKAERTKMNKLSTALKDRRIAIEKDFKKPLEDFSKWVKDLDGKIQSCKEPIDKAINTFDEAERVKREEYVKAEITKMAGNFNVESNEIEFQKSWSNKSSFTKTGKLTKSTLIEITDAMKMVASAKEQLENSKTIIRNYAKAIDLEPESWLQLVEDGSSSADLMKQMDDAVKAKRERLENERKREEYEKAIVSIEEPTEEINGVLIDPETGEIKKSQKSIGGIDISEGSVVINANQIGLGNISEEGRVAVDPFPVSKSIVKVIMAGDMSLIDQGIKYLKDLGLEVQVMDE